MHFNDRESIIALTPLWKGERLPDGRPKVADSIPMGYYGLPEDLAGIVSLLCSREGRYITGQSIYVDGGKSL